VRKEADLLNREAETSAAKPQRTCAQKGPILDARQNFGGKAAAKVR
jgi:hypothetical protein